MKPVGALTSQLERIRSSVAGEIRSSVAGEMRPLSPTEHLALRICESIATVAVAAFACTLSPLGTFVAGLGWALVLFELARWERAGG